MGNMLVTTSLRVCWVRASNLRQSAIDPAWVGEPLLRTVVIEHIKVAEECRRQGHCKRFIEWVGGDARYDLVIVEGVQNQILLDALKRWGWFCDHGVKDFYKPRTTAASLAVARHMLNTEP